MKQILLHEDTARYDLWLRLLLFGMPVVFLVLGAVNIGGNAAEAYTMLGTGVFLWLVFWAIMPQRFQIYEDRLRVKLGGPFGFSLSFANISEVKRISGFRAMTFMGIQYATSTRGALEIVRRKGTNISISPTGGDGFLERLNEAIRSAAG